MPTWVERRGSDALGVGDGIHAVAGGAGFIITTPRVWGYALVPAGIALVLTVGLSVLGVWGAARVSNALLGEPDGFWANAGSWLVTVLVSAVALLLAVVCALSLAQPLSGFSLEAIVHAQERALTGRSTPEVKLAASVFLSLKIALVTVTFAVVAFGMLFLVGLFFPPALVVTLPLKFLLGSCLLAWDFLDYPLGLRGLGVRARLRWVRRHFSAVTAFGVSWALLLVVPGIVLLILPMGVAGAARLAVAAERADDWEGE
jgi:CysZ protein